MRVWGLILGLTLLAVASVRAQDHIRTVHQEYTFDPRGEIALTTYKGSVTISPWDLPQVLIDARIEAEDYDEILMLPNIEIRMTGTIYALEIETDYRKAVKKITELLNTSAPRLPHVHYVIRMPRTATLKVEDYMSDTHIADFQADLDVYTYKGNVEVTNFGGALTLDTFMGTAQVDFGTLTRDCSISSQEGHVAVQVPSGLGFDLDLDLGTQAIFAYDGHLANASQEAAFVRLTEKRKAAYQEAINGGGARLSLTTQRGSVRLRGL